MSDETSKDVVMEDEEDELLHECDVYLNRMYDPPDFVGDMYLLQYPLRPSYRPYGDQGSLERVELKPKSRRLRFMYKLNQNDHFQDEEVVMPEKTYEQRHTLNSTVVVNPACSYAVGVLRQGRMTLTPIRAVNQLRPDFEEFDKRVAKQNAGVAAGPPGPPGEGERENSEPSGGEEPMDLDVNPVRVEYVKDGDSSRFAAPDADDAWKRLDFFDASSPEAADIYLQHIVFACQEASEAEMQGQTSSDHPKLQDLDLDGDHISFVRGFCGQAARARLRQARQELAKKAGAGLSSYILSKMPVERQVESILRHFGVVSFMNLRRRLPPSTLRSLPSDQALVNMLKVCGVLVCGNWILKSTLANFEGMEASARDLLLTMLNLKAGKLVAKEVIKWKSVFQQSVSVETLREIAEGLMEESQDKERWSLKAEQDQDFIRKYPELVAEYNEWLESRKAEVVKGGKEGVAKGTTLQGSGSASSSRLRGKLVPEVRECLLSGPKTTEEMKKLVQRKHPTLEIREEDLISTLNAKELDALQVRGVWVLAGTGTESHDKFRKTLLTLFKSKDSVTRQDVMEEYERVHGERCKLSDYIIRQQLREIAEKIEDGRQTVYVVKGALQTR